MKTYKIRMVDGSKVNMRYDELCHMLGFIPESHFIKVTTANTISFSIGKPREIMYLRMACRNHGIKMAKALANM